MANSKCPLCGSITSLYKVVDSEPYFECRRCDFISLGVDALARHDTGETVRAYDANYWQSEIAAARARAAGPGLARAAEVFLLARRPIGRFIDIAAGGGYLLDALSFMLPSSREVFHGVEMFPPEESQRTDHPNFTVGSLGDLQGTFDGGLCMEVIEHLTPSMLADLASQLAARSVPGSLFLFNTGLTDFVRKEDPGYIDPKVRGHICIWSVTAVRRIFERHGFHVFDFPHRSWAFVVERPLGGIVAPDSLEARIWSPLAENVARLRDPLTNDVMYLLARDGIRAR